MAEHLTVTPSGIEILHEDGLPDPATGKSRRRSYEVNGHKLVSVTTALGIIDKPGLMWGAEKLTVLAAIKLAREGELPLHVDGALSRMKARGLRFRQVWDKKAERGTVTHEDLVALCKGAELQDLDSYYSSEQRGFIRGASAWYADSQPQVIDSETMVASLAHGFAGRYDLYTKLGSLPAGLSSAPPGISFRVDVKTSEELPRFKDGSVKAPYPEMLLQLAAYELAARESGYGHSDLQAILRIEASGEYDFWVTDVDERAFLAILTAYRTVRELPNRRVEIEAVAA